MMSRALFVVIIGALCAGGADAAVAKKQSAIQNGTTIRARVEAKGVYNQECYDAYYGCMDQFCIAENENGGSCSCSDKNAEYESQLADIQKILNEANRISTEEVEKIQAGANADIIFNGTRQYDEYGNIVSVDAQNKSAQQSKEKKRADLLSLWDSNFDDEDEIDTIADKTGNALFSAAHNLCVAQMDDACDKDINFLHQVYARQITSDCKAFENSIAKQKSNADLALANAKADVRSALRDSLNEANKYDLGQCMVEFKKCMLTEDACGKDWTNCVSTVASTNMQNNAAVSTAKTKAATVATYDITAPTMEILSTKRTICERVLNSCVAVRDMVWPAFLKEAAPTIRLAESNAESKFRQSCLSTISSCIQKACKDDIAGKGVATMDACLSRPDMARSFCKVEIDPCERMEPLIWGYVTDKLAAMRVDACTEEVKACFTDDNRCGADFSKCIGMDYNYIHDICPIDKLVVCKANNPKFSMTDLDSMLMGLYLNIDNSALETCQNLAEAKMLEICGSTTDCNKFAADETMGTGSLQYQKDGAIHRLTGMISFGKVNVGMDKENAGLIDIQDYVNFLSEAKVVPREYGAVADTVLYELENIQGTINRVITMIEQDPEIQFCVNGRDLSQINGKSGSKTTGRFPNLLNQVKMQIAIAALRQAQDNYNKKYNEYLGKAMDGATIDMANLMCNKLPAANGTAAGISAPELNTSVIPMGALVAEFGGVSNSSLAAGGTHSSQRLGGARMSTASGAAAGGSDGGETSTITSGVISSGLSKFQAMGGKFAMSFNPNPTAMIADATVKAVVALASDTYSSEFDGGTREMWSTFNRDTRVCHVCTSTVTQDCHNTGSRGFLGLWDSRGVSCTSNEPVEKCEDIQM
ncbi:MAG: hypothetical protein IKP05_03000 [Alphaproteobacteria bacterium]|nr:hypothetical protein [Alphaproteobacteria bacterium]